MPRTTKARGLAARAPSKTAVTNERDKTKSRARLRRKIESALLAHGENSFVANEVAFHMTDWLDDLNALVDLYSGRTRWTPARVDDVLGDFLVHVPNHIAAAGKVLCDFEVDDIFQVGAIAGSKPKRSARSPRFKG
jgi:hypothetical protein